MHQSGLPKEAEGLEKIAVARKWFVEARTAKVAVAVSLVVALGLAACASSTDSAKETKPSEASEQSGTDSAAPSESVSSSESAAPSESVAPAETSAAAKPSANSSKPGKSASKPKPKINRKKFGANTVVMEGTVRIMSNGQLLKHGSMKSLKGRLPSDADKLSDRYPILVLDRPTKLTGYQADPEPRTETVKYVSLGHSSPEWANLNVWERYDGKRVIVVANQDDFGWPSDVSMPLGWLRFGGHETADIIVR